MSDERDERDERGEHERREAAEFEPIARRLAEASRRIEPPAGLVDSIDMALRDAQRRRWRLRFVAAPLAAAAVLALAVVGWLALRQPVAPRPERPPLAIETRPDSPAPTHAPSIAEPRPVVRVALDESSPWIARPIESRSPNVTIVLLYQQAVAAAPDDAATPPPSSQGSTS
jgi:hypothetical protein